MARTNEQAKRTHIFGRAKLNSQALVVICILLDYLEESNVNTGAVEFRGPGVRIPAIVTTCSDGSRPPVPIDRDQFDGAVRCIF
jgi:hypothetical protein